MATTQSDPQEVHKHMDVGEFVFWSYSNYGRWVRMEPDWSHDLEMLYQSALKFYSNGVHPGIMQFSYDQIPYQVDWCACTQQNMDTGIIRRLLRSEVPRLV